MHNADTTTHDPNRSPDDAIDAEEQALNVLFARDAAREINTALKFWFACPTKRCRRNRRCSGDPARCHAIFWPVVPEEAKAWWRALADSRRDGLSARQAARVAGDAVMRHRRAAALRANPAGPASNAPR